MMNFPNRIDLTLTSFVKLHIFGLLIGLLLGCEDFVEVDPPTTSLVGEIVFKDDITATSAMLGIYANMVESAATMFTNEISNSILLGMSSDELINYSSSPVRVNIEQNDLTEDNSTIQGRWNEFYKFIYSCNSVIEGLTKSQSLTDSLAVQFEGEARFIRAWMYFYLVNLWGDVPLALTSDYQTNSLLPRTSSDKIYSQILDDLLDAREFLSDNYPSDTRVRPNKASANSLLARVYLHLEDWDNAESEASKVIEDGRYTLENSLNDVFLIESQEAIWQLQSLVPIVGTYDALRFILTRRPSSGISLRPELISTFEPGDKRLEEWTGSVISDSETFYFPNKYTERFLFGGATRTQYKIVFRLAEIYLIRAEARARLGNILGAQDDVNIIRQRAGLLPITVSDQSAILSAIAQEKRIELFTELGLRWLDLKRTGRATEVLSPIKPGWQETDELYPVPLQEFLNNPNLGQQNPGY